jgi:hypothetical protein
MSHELDVRVNRGPRPGIADSRLAAAFFRDALGLHDDRGPNLVALDAAGGKVVQDFVLIGRARLAKLHQELL